MTALRSRPPKTAPQNMPSPQQAVASAPRHHAAHRQTRAVLGLQALLLIATSAHAAAADSSGTNAQQVTQDAKPQWYTGSLVSPSGALVKKGVFAWEPYMTYSQPVGYLNNNNGMESLHPRQKAVSNFTLYKYSITDTISIQLTPVISYRWKKGNNTSSGLKFGDLPVDLMWRYVNADPKRYIPALSIFAGMAMLRGIIAGLAARRTE